MTREEKAKAYDEALEWMRKVYPTLTGADKEDAEHYFPGLKVSEDEKIRKDIVAAVEMYGDFTQSRKEEIYAYLEKQKEPRDYRKLYKGVSQSEWFKESEDEKMINGLQGFLSAFGSDYFGTGGWQKFDDWLEKQKVDDWLEKQKEQKPAENGGKELLYVSNQSYNIGYRDGKREEFINRLKSLRPSWKPSEEQMDALKSKLPIIKGTGNNVDSILESLYEQLKQYQHG